MISKFKLSIGTDHIQSVAWYSSQVFTGRGVSSFQKLDQISVACSQKLLQTIVRVSNWGTQPDFKNYDEWQQTQFDPGSDRQGSIFEPLSWESIVFRQSCKPTELNEKHLQQIRCSPFLYEREKRQKSDAFESCSKKGARWFEIKSIRKNSSTTILLIELIYLMIN